MTLYGHIEVVMKENLFILSMWALCFTSDSDIPYTLQVSPHLRLLYLSIMYLLITIFLTLTVKCWWRITVLQSLDDFLFIHLYLSLILQ